MTDAIQMPESTANPAEIAKLLLNEKKFKQYKVKTVAWWTHYFALCDAKNIQYKFTIDFANAKTNADKSVAYYNLRTLEFPEYGMNAMFITFEGHYTLGKLNAIASKEKEGEKKKLPSLSIPITRSTQDDDDVACFDMLVKIGDEITKVAKHVCAVSPANQGSLYPRFRNMVDRIAETVSRKYGGQHPKAGEPLPEPIVWGKITHGLPLMESKNATSEKDRFWDPNTEIFNAEAKVRVAANKCVPKKYVNPTQEEMFSIFTRNSTAKLSFKWNAINVSNMAMSLKPSITRAIVKSMPIDEYGDLVEDMEEEEIKPLPIPNMSAESGRFTPTFRMDPTPISNGVSFSSISRNMRARELDADEEFDADPDNFGA